MANFQKACSLILLIAVFVAPGLCQNKLEEQGALTLCKNWTNNNDIQKLLSNVSRARACPCRERLIRYDIQFDKRGSCYQEIFFRDGVKLICCYDEEGILNNRNQHSGYIVFENYQDAIESMQRTCCLHRNTCDLFYDTIPFQDCESYENPTIVESWGDAHIQTLTGDTYDFNGHGEYVFLDVDNGSLIIQCRLEYLSETNTDATILTAFSLKVIDKAALEITLNKTSRNITFKDTNTDSSPFTVHQIGSQLAVKLAKGKIQMKLIVSGTEDLSIKIIGPPRDVSAKGLAGNSTKGLVLRNHTAIPIASPALHIYEFGLSWKLSTSSESNFLYNETGKNFSYYNDDKKRPLFPENYLTNLTVMFTKFGNHSTDEINKYKKLCNVTDIQVKRRCLVSIARTGNTSDARRIIEIYNDTQIFQNLLSLSNNTAPQFRQNFKTNFQLTLNVNETFILNVNEYVYDNDSDDTLKYEVMPKGNLNISIDSHNGTLTLDVDKWLRNYTDPITIIVTDEAGNAIQKTLTFQFCGCERQYQCQPINSINNVESVQQAGCRCNDYYSGKFCEQPLGVCNRTTCYENVTCNATADVSGENPNPCGECPDGYEGDGKTCTDEDECELGTAKCEQHCNNTVGNFTCWCDEGYNLTNNGINCEDIDECDLQSNCTKDNTKCKNIPGSYQCVCTDGFFLNDKGECSFDIGRYVYIGKLPLSFTTCQDDIEIDETSLSTQLQMLIPNSSHYTNVEYLNTTTGNKTKNVLFALRSKKNPNVTTVQIKLNEKQVTSWNISTKDEKNCFAVGNAVMFNDTDNMLCKTLHKEHCDQISTRCVQEKGESRCVCKKGFENKRGTPENVCYDVDECKTGNDTFFKKNCVHGDCTNTIGSWNCSCPENTFYMKVGEDKYRCQGNFSYFGEIQIVHLSQQMVSNETIEDFIKNLIKGRIENESSNMNGNSDSATEPPLSELFVDTKVYEFNTIDIPAPNIYIHIILGYIYTARYIIRMGDPVYDTECLQKNLNTSITNDTMLSYVHARSVTLKLFDENENLICNKPFGNNCDLNSTTCVSGNGTYTCPCKQGFERIRNDEYICYDVRECYRDEFQCTNGGTCFDQLGNWTCICPNGFLTTYFNYHNITCEDINECLDNTTYTCKGGTCINTQGGWDCSCETGYTLFVNTENNKTCEDVDECKKVDQCKHGNCSNTPGNFTCSCPKGLENVVTNSRNIALCSGSNSYKFQETITFSRRLNSTELQSLQTKFEEKIQMKFNSKFPNRQFTVVVHITEIPRKKRSNQEKLKCQMNVEIHANGMKEEGLIQNLLEDTPYDEILNKTIPNVTLTRDPKSQQTVYGNNTTAAPEEKNTTTMPGENHNTAAPGENYTTAAPEGKHTTAAPEEKSLKTILIASAGSFGGVVLILVITIVIICRKRKKEEKEKPNKEENISLSTVGNNFSNGIRTWDNQQTSNVDRASRSSSFMSNGLSPGFIPRVSLLAGSEPRPDYGSPPVSQKPAFQRPASMNMDYGRHGSPNYDFHGQQYPRTSYGSYDSDAGRGNMNMDYFGHKKPVTNPLYSEVRRKT